MDNIILKVKIKKLYPEAVMPKFAHGPLEDAGADLSACLVNCEHLPLLVPPGDWALIPTGISIELPPGYEAQIRSRSGLALHHGIIVLNAPATIDPSYRGEIRVILYNAGQEVFKVEHGDRIAQMVIARYEPCEYEQRIEGEPSDTTRGCGGFGSSGTT